MYYLNTRKTFCAILEMFSYGTPTYTIIQPESSIRTFSPLFSPETNNPKNCHMETLTTYHREFFTTDSYPSRPTIKTRNDNTTFSVAFLFTIYQTVSTLSKMIYGNKTLCCVKSGGSEIRCDNICSGSIAHSWYFP